MSGDVQPRKRKDKKKKRDAFDRKSEGEISFSRQSSFQDDETSSHGVHITKMGSDDVHLHVQHDHGTGGHWCAKIFFFSLLAILVGLVALIIMENRGLSDLDTPLSESRFSNYFDGWVEEHRQEHDHEDPVQASIEAHDEHDEPFEEQEDHSEYDDEGEGEDGDDEEDDEEPEPSEEVAPNDDDDEQTKENDDEEDDEDNITKEVTIEQTNEEYDDNDDDNGDDGDDDDDDIEAADDDNNDDDATKEVNREETVEEDDADENNNDDNSNNNGKNADASQENEEKNNNDDDDDDFEEQIQPIYSRSTQQTPNSQQSNTNNDDDDDPFDEEDDDGTFESMENVVDNDAEEMLLLQEKARKQAAEAAKNEPPSAENDEDDEAAEATPSWVSSQIKPKEDIGGGPKSHNDELDSFEDELQKVNEQLEQENYAVAAKAFGLLARNYPDKPQVFLGKAKALDQLADKQRSNKLLDDALDAYKRYLAFGADDIKNDKEYRAAAERCIERMRFIGHFGQSIPIHKQLIAHFDTEPGPRNELAVTYLLQNRLSDAKQVLQELLTRWPMDGYAQVHYGFVLRQLDKDYENAVIYLQHGIKSKAPGTQDGRFYFNLGDSLQRLGRQAEALEVYKSGAALKLFPSAYQRSLYNEPNLRAQPFWRKEDTTYAVYFNKLERNWQAIRDEALSVLHRRGYFLDETESLRDTGNWQQFELYARGYRNQKNCQKAPITCSLIEEFRAASGCRRGQVKFSVMQPGTHVHAHCGPTNCRLRAHLGLIVPSEGTHLRVAEEGRTWKEGKFLIFDDSFEHEVWHNGSSFRMVLIVDVWHPDLSVKQRQTLSPI